MAWSLSSTGADPKASKSGRMVNVRSARKVRILLFLLNFDGDHVSCRIAGFAVVERYFLFVP